MIKKLIALVLVLVVGVYIGFQLPRGAGLIAALTSVGSSNESNYTALKIKSGVNRLQGYVRPYASDGVG